MLKISIYNSNGELTNQALFKSEDECNSWYSENIKYLPIDHKKTIGSIEDEISESLRDQESDEAIDLGTNLIKQIRKINRRKLKLGLWTEKQFNDLLLSELASKIERALWNGSLVTAAYLLKNMFQFYSDTEIQELIKKIEDHEKKWSDLI